jgi:hypothetical protein
MSVSPLYASLGPRPAAVQAFVAGELGLAGEAADARRETTLEEHRRWGAAHLEAGRLASGRPSQPHADVLDVFNRPPA